MISKQKILKILIASGLFLHLKAIWHQKLFGDEIHSLFFMKNNAMWSLLSKSVEPIHPNGIYVLLKILYWVFPSVLVLRIWMFVIFLASCWILWLLLEKIFMKKIEKLIGLSIWVSSAYIWHFSFQLRMYGPAFLLVLLSTLSLLKNKKKISLVLDWLLLFFAYGGVLFVIAKWISYFCITFFRNNSKKKIKSYIPYFSGILLPVLIILINFISREKSINTSFLYWVKVPIWNDWSLGLGSFLTGLFLPYFEGYAFLGTPWLKLGILMNMIFLFIFFNLLLRKKLKNRCLSYFKKLSYSKKYLLVLSLLMMMLYTTILIYSIFFGSHIFHIRQLFTVAVILLLIFVLILEKIWEYNQNFGFVLLLFFLIINQASIFRDNWNHGQAYNHHFESLPGKPVIASSGDIELIFKQCGTFDRSAVRNQCKNKDIYLAEDNLSDDLKKDTWWQTTSYAENNDFPNDDCKKISLDFYECKKIYED